MCYIPMHGDRRLDLYSPARAERQLGASTPACAVLSFDVADQSIIDARLPSVDAGRVEHFSTQERARSSVKGFIQSSSRDLINYISF